MSSEKTCALQFECFISCMYAYCSKVARTKSKLERTTKYNTRTNTFTKHSKRYKMGCIGPSISCSSIWNFVQIVRKRCRRRLSAQFYRCQRASEQDVKRETDFQSRSQMDEPSPPTDRHTHPPTVDLHPTQSDGLDHVFLSHLGNENESKIIEAGWFFFSLQLPIIQPKKRKTKQQQKVVWEESKPKTLVVSENTCLYMSGYILFDMWTVHLFTLPFSLFFFFNIYIKASKKYIKQRVPTHSLRLYSAQQGSTKIKILKIREQ